MNIELVDKSGTQSLKVLGQISSLQDTIEFKQHLQRACASGPVNIYFEDCIMIPSSVLGAILQKKEIDKMTVKVFVRQKELIESLQRLRLSDILNLTQY